MFAPRFTACLTLSLAFSCADPPKFHLSRSVPAPAPAAQGVTPPPPSPPLPDPPRVPKPPKWVAHKNEPVAWVFEGSPHRTTLMFHGMCSKPDWECEHFRELDPGASLVCPRGPLSCGQGGMWPLGASFLDRIALGDQGVDLKHVTTCGGFSLGATRLLAWVETGEISCRNVVLVGGDVSPHAATLRKRGVEKLILAAGSADMVHPRLAAAAKRLARLGFDVSFVAFPGIGHSYPTNVAEVLAPYLESEPHRNPAS